MGLTIVIKVVPGSGRQQWSLDKSGTLKCFLKSPPEKGKANAELIKYLSNALKLPQHAITIVQGDTARKKTITIDAPGLSSPELFKRIGLERQETL